MPPSVAGSAVPHPAPLAKPSAPTPSPRKSPATASSRATSPPSGFKGYISGAALAKKLRLLATEGVRFKNDRLTEPKRAIR